MSTKEKAETPTLIHIGAREQTVIAARNGLISILDACQKHDPKVAVAAVRAFSAICAVNNTTITGCRFDVDTASSAIAVRGKC